MFSSIETSKEWAPILSALTKEISSKSMVKLIYEGLDKYFEKKFIQDKQINLIKRKLNKSNKNWNKKFIKKIKTFWS